jgi:radical SAM-linked protein
MNLLHFKKPTRYIDNEINTVKKEAEVKVALAFPDTYEIGMSHLGLKVLYKIINSVPFALCERVFAPWVDMANYIENSGRYLSTLESGRPLKEFDIVGFSLQYELSYPTLLRMLKLGGIEVERDKRNSPIIIAGGPCTVNPYPLKDFIDVFLIGDGEEAVVELLNIYREYRKDKDAFLRALSQVEGFYVPDYTEGTVRRYIRDLNQAVFPTDPPVPYAQVVHDRINIEISRGCTRGCRFCQAGIFYRPLRERSPEKILNLVEESLVKTGYDEVSFTSLNVGDYSRLLPLLKAFNRRYGSRKISVSLPSLRVGAVTRELLQEIKSVKKSGFTIAPEAGTERLRSVINKDFLAEEYERALEALFSEGWLNLKLYFMIGLPTETEEDLLAIADMARQALSVAKRFIRRYVNLTVSVSPFVPKPFTPFQWYGQEPLEVLKQKTDLLKEKIPRGITLKIHDLKMSLLEAALSRAPEETGKLIKAAFERGAYLDGWSEHFNYQYWAEAMERTGISIEELATKRYSPEEHLPWDGIDLGIKKEYLQQEYKRALSAQITTDCNTDRCHVCGLGCKSREFIKDRDSILVHSDREGVFSMDIGCSGIARPVRFNPVKVRIEHQKRGIMKYISTIELMNTLLRGLRRAGVSIVYSEGYSPSPKISMGPALNVGVESLKEYFDIEVYPPFDIISMREKINSVMPEGLKINKMAFIHKKVPSISSFVTTYEYEIVLPEGTGKGIKLFNISRSGTYSEFILKFDIIDKRKFILRIRDLKEKKAKLKEIVEILFGLPAEELEITRVGLYGYHKGKWVDPMELLAMF